MTTGFMRKQPRDRGRRPVPRAGGNKLAQRGQELPIQHRRSRSTADGVVGEHGELPVQKRARPQAAYRGSHALAAHAVQPRLRPVFGRTELYRLDRRGGQCIAGQGRKFAPGVEDLLSRRPGRQLDADALSMAVFHRHPVAVRTHPGVQRFYPVSAQLAQQFQRLSFEFFFLALDVGDDIAQDVERGDPRITGAADGLHGAHKYALQAKAIGQRLQRQHQPDGAAVGVGHDVAAGLISPALRLQQVRDGLRLPREPPAEHPPAYETRWNWRSPRNPPRQTSAPFPAQCRRRARRRSRPARLQGSRARPSSRQSGWGAGCPASSARPRRNFCRWTCRWRRATRFQTTGGPRATG